MVLSLASETVEKLALSAPFLLKMIGKIWTGLEKVVNKLTKQDPNPNSLGQKIIQFADKAHHKVMIPFEFIAKKVTNDPKKQKLIAEVMFLTIIGALLLQTGASVASNVAAKNFSTKLAVKTAKGAVKGAELGKGVVHVNDIVKSIRQAAEDIL